VALYFLSTDPSRRQRVALQLEPPEAAKVVSALITTHIPSFTSVNLSVPDLQRFFAADTLCYAVTLFLTP